MSAGRLVAVFGYSRRRTGRLHGICADRLAYAQENAPGWSEAEPMRAAWTGPDVQLICDAQARSTADNAANVAALARELRAEELVVVTSPWHRTRARILVGAALRGSGIRFSVEAAEGPRPSWLLAREVVCMAFLPLQLRRARGGGQLEPPTPSQSPI